MTVADEIAAVGYGRGAAIGEGDLEALRSVWARLGPRRFARFHATIHLPDPVVRKAVDAALRRVLEPWLSRLLPTHRLVVANFVAKAAADAEGEVPPHRDYTFVDEPRQRSVGLWLPLADVTAENGALGVVPKSHHEATAPRPVFPPLAMKPSPEEALRGALRLLDMRAGEVLLFDHGLVHGSPPNRSGRPRIAIGGVLAPRDVPVRYLHCEERPGGVSIETYEVDDGFYLRHRLGDRPSEGTLVRVEPWSPPE